MENKEEVCECGHLEESHTIGTGRCSVNFCECRGFVNGGLDE